MGEAANADEGTASQIARLETENAELKAKVWLLERDVSILGPENRQLSNAYAAARAEIARLKAPKPKKRGRPSKEVTGTVEEYLVRETLEELTKAAREKKRITEKQAAMLADARLRATAKQLQDHDMPGAFAAYSPDYPADEDSIYKAFRRGKRRMGFAGAPRTKNTAI